MTPIELIFTDSFNLSPLHQLCNIIHCQSEFYELFDLRKRKPKSANVSYFKINKKYLAVGYIENDTFFYSN